MNRFESLSDLILATIMQKLTRRNGRYALALASERFLDVYKRNRAWIERADYLATRMQQLWRARVRPCVSNLRDVMQAVQYLDQLVERDTNNITSARLQSLADHFDNVDLGKIDFSILNSCTFESTFETFVGRLYVRQLAHMLRYIILEFDKNTIERVDFVFVDASLGTDAVLATRRIRANEKNCILFLDFPTSRARWHELFLVVKPTDRTNQNVWFQARAFQSFCSPMHFSNHTFINPKRWRGKCNASRIVFDDATEVVDHTPQSLQTD
jgi:hypothetical protein